MSGHLGLILLLSFCSGLPERFERVVVVEEEGLVAQVDVDVLPSFVRDGIHDLEHRPEKHIVGLRHLGIDYGDQCPVAEWLPGRRGCRPVISLAFLVTGV